MKDENLKLVSAISQDILHAMLIYEKDGVVSLPKTYMNDWQRKLFQIVVDENKKSTKQ